MFVNSATVSFVKMTMDLVDKTLSVRRLTTISDQQSSAKSLADAAAKFTTTWCWYRLENKQWIPYGDDVSVKCY